MSAFADILDTLAAGELAILPTETVYGLAARADDSEAVEKIYTAKGRDFDKPLALCVRDLDQAQTYGQFDAMAQDLAAQYWPGPVTLVVRAKAVLALDPRVTAKAPFGRTIGFRCPDVFWREEMTHPIALTSANLSGGADCVSLEDAKAELGERIAALPALAALSGAASTILSVIDGEVKVLRQGETQVSL